MLGCLSSNSLLSFESSQANIHSCINFLQRTVVQICCDSKVFPGTFPYKWSRLNLHCTIHLNSADYLPCTVTLQMTAQPPNAKLAFYCHWIIICSSGSCIHTKCAVSKERKREGESENVRMCVCVCWGDLCVNVSLIEPDRYVIRADLNGQCWLIADILINEYWCKCWQMWKKTAVQ